MSWTKEGEWYDDGSTSVYVQDWCPECVPDGVPEPYTLRLCSIHTPSIEGSADLRARGDQGSYWQSGSADVDPKTNSRWCDLLHGRIPNTS